MLARAGRKPANFASKIKRKCKIINDSWNSSTDRCTQITVDCGAVYLYTDFTTGIFDSKGPVSINEYHLYQNYPNPFNPSTIISYTVTEMKFVTLKIYDVLGNEVATLVNEYKPAGEYEVEFNSHSGEVRNLPAGKV